MSPSLLLQMTGSVESFAAFVSDLVIALKVDNARCEAAIFEYINHIAWQSLGEVPGLYASLAAKDYESLAKSLKSDTLRKDIMTELFNVFGYKMLQNA